MSVPTPEAPKVAEEVDGQTSAVNEPPAEHIDGEESLGDPGKKALDAMKAKWKAAEDRAKAAEAAAAEALAKAEGKEKEYAAEQERRKVEMEALSKVNQRILKAEIKAAAKGILADPTDALTFIDLSPFEVGDDGEVDAQAITAAIDNLIKSKPYLAAQGERRFQGGADGGPRKETGPSLEDQIAAAQKVGNYALAIALKRQLSQSRNP